jgi:hypothetical protein
MSVITKLIKFLLKLNQTSYLIKLFLNQVRLLLISVGVESKFFAVPQNTQFFMIIKAGGRYIILLHNKP